MAPAHVSRFQHDEGKSTPIAELRAHGRAAHAEAKVRVKGLMLQAKCMQKYLHALPVTAGELLGVALRGGPRTDGTLPVQPLPCPC